MRKGYLTRGQHLRSHLPCFRLTARGRQYLGIGRRVRLVRAKRLMPAPRSRRERTLVRESFVAGMRFVLLHGWEEPTREGRERVAAVLGFLVAGGDPAVVDPCAPRAA